MLSIEGKIQGQSARNAELQRILQETDSAVPDLEAQKRYVSDTERQVADAASKLKQLDNKRKKELKEHESYRDSVMKRFAFKLTGKTEKFQAKAAKEEREYFDVLQEEHQANTMKQNLDAMLEEARRVQRVLEGKAETHAQAQKDLDNLYELIFNGPSPGFPDEDKKEREMKAAAQAYQEARSRAENEGQAINILSQAQQRLNGALMSMEDALHASRRDMFGGGTFTDMMERSALQQAESQVQQAKMLVRQARRCSPAVRNLPPVRIDQGSLFADVFFDNIFTDMAFHEKIQQSNLEVQRCADALNWDLGAAKHRHMDLSRGTDQKGAAMRQARFNLQKAREAAFERISSASSDEPPAYIASAESGKNWWEK